MNSESMPDFSKFGMLDWHEMFLISMYVYVKCV